MNLPEEAIFFSSLISLVIVGPLIGMYFLLFRAYKKLVQKFIDLEVVQKSAAEDAAKQASDIVVSARSQAKQIISSASLTSSQMSEDFAKALGAAKDAQVTQYTGALNKASADVVKSLQGISNEIQNNSKQQLVAFQKDLQAQVAESQGMIGQMVDQSVASVTAEIEKYKKERMAGIDKEVSLLAEKLAKQYLGRSLSEEEHVRLVKKALEQAKRENVL
jgi:F0F1-type ATP synthase membrane subunit b/b'